MGGQLGDLTLIARLIIPFLPFSRTPAGCLERRFEIPAGPYTSQLHHSRSSDDLRPAFPVPLSSCWPVFPFPSRRWTSSPRRRSHCWEWACCSSGSGRTSGLPPSVGRGYKQMTTSCGWRRYVFVHRSTITPTDLQPGCLLGRDGSCVHGGSVLEGAGQQ
jgi:hypothetical protein